MPEKSVLAAFKHRLGKVPDQKIADQAKVSRTLVVNYRKKLGIPAYQGHKGTSTIARAAESPADRPFRGRRSALDPFLDRLGTVPDAEIARLAGVTAENVRTYRQRRRIAPAWQGAEGSSPPPAAAPTVEPRAADTAAVATPASSERAPARAAARKAKPAVEPSPAPEAARSLPAVAPVPAEPEGTMPASGTAFVVMVDTEQGPRSYALIAPDIAAAAAVAAARVPARHPDGVIRAIQRVAELLPV